MKDFSLNRSCEIIIDSIYSYVHNIQWKFNSKVNDEKLEKINELDYDDTMKALPLFEETILRINHNLNELYNKSVDESFYFFDCSIEVYRSSYNERLLSFLNENSGSIELDFIKNEINKLKNPINNRALYSQYGKLSYSRFLLENTKFNVSIRRKDEFLKEKVKLLDFSKSFYDGVFISFEAEEWHNQLLYKLGAINGNDNALRGISAISNAVFSNKKCKEHIFKYNLTSLAYQKFLNKKFSASLKENSKLSSPLNHEIAVASYIEEYIRILEKE